MAHSPLYREPRRVPRQSSTSLLRTRLLVLAGSLLTFALVALVLGYGFGAVHTPQTIAFATGDRSVTAPANFDGHVLGAAATPSASVTPTSTPTPPSRPTVVPTRAAQAIARPTQTPVQPPPTPARPTAAAVRPTATAVRQLPSSAGGAASAAGAAASPDQVVVAFYQDVGAHDYAAAEALWSSRMLATYPPAQNIVQRFSQTRQITVQRASVVSGDTASGKAVVAVTILEVTDHSQTWTGTWSLVWTSSGWLMDQPNLTAG